MQNKRGLSAIIGTLLIILLVIVAVGIVWVVVRGVIEDSSDDISFSTFTSSAQVENAYVDGTNAYVTVKRDEGEGNMLGVKVVVSDGQNSVVQEFMADEGGALEALETGTFAVDISELSGTPTTVTIAPILEIESGESVLGSVTDTYLFSDGSNPSGESGGDPLPGEVCGNNIIDGADVCDGTALSSETCVTQGFDAGTLGCLPDCTGYDNSSCTGGSCVDDSTELCALQLGACALSEQTCTGSAWPGCNYTLLVGTPPYEVEEESCSDEVDNDCDGLMDCDDTQCATDPVCNLILANGVIAPLGSVWPSSAPRFFDSPDLPTDDVGIATYLGKWVSFLGRTDLCFQISAAAHNYDAGSPPEIPEYNMSFIGFQYAISSPNLVNSEVFNVYKTQAACVAAWSA